jgi:drug/metabolite transporter (DMT)-like permease
MRPPARRHAGPPLPSGAPDLYQTQVSDIARPAIETETPPPARRDRIPLGILLMIVTTVLFTVMSTISKWLTQTYPVGEVLFIRAAVAMAASAAIILPSHGLAVFRTRKLNQHVMRSVSQTISQSCILIAFTLMPLADVVAIAFSAPLFATLLAALFLRERVGPARWTALLVGFAGVLIVARPSHDLFQIGALFALGNAVLYASVTVGVRGMTSTESTPTLLMYQVSLLTLFFSPSLLFGFVMPTAPAIGAMVVSGLLNVLAQYLWTVALRYAPPSAISPFYYLSLVWAMIAGFVVWGDVPTLALLAGSVVVVASGLFLLWRESGRI